MNNIVEIWRDILGYEGLYKVSNLGNVKSLEKWRNNGNGGYIQKEKILLQSNTSTGYKKIELTKGGKKKSFKIHRLVAIAYIHNPKNKPSVNHINGNPIDNNVSNLEWCTQRENMLHAYDIGLNKRNVINKELLKNMYYNQNKSMNNIAIELGLTKSIVSNNMKRYGFKGLKRSMYGLTKSFICKELETKKQFEIAKEIGCSQSLISKILNKKEINNAK